MNSVGNRLKIARINARLLQDQVIEKLKDRGYDITQVTLSRYENDKREVGIELLRQLSLIYKVSVETIIWDQEELQLIKQGKKI
jgi:transcriptional regulator with XRE-family HTH domain